MSKELQSMIDTGNPEDNGSEPMGTPYDKDVVAWAREQAALLRAGKLSAIDIEHIAEEIEDVGKSEQREFASRMSVLLAHLLKWKFQPDRRGNSWRNTIRTQRAAVERRLARTPSLRPMLDDQDWIADMWGDASITAANEMRIGMADLPDHCPWSMKQVLETEFLPD
ncbi:hypothetical protein GCM10010985_43350 [Caballeronia grimmiae]|uniref:DUF29 domain-containing protein n=3 Tax=Caballeronia grimmiae TaxID=1071679 RepID=A0ABQ1RY37_9BURK|nr:hypothetical protein GCM10010985_43350 [Caballeronia grimmiae]